MTDYYRKKIDDTINDIAETEGVLKNLNRPNYEEFLTIQDQSFYMRFKKKNVNSFSKLNTGDRPRLIVREYPDYIAYILWGILAILSVTFSFNKTIISLIGLVCASYFFAVILSVIFYPLTEVLDKKFIRAKLWNRYYSLENRHQNFIQEERDYDLKIKEYENSLLELKKSLEYYQKSLIETIKREKEKERQIAFEKQQREEEERQIRIKRLEQQYWLNLNGYEFEDAVCKLYEDKGFNISPTSYSNDGGADLIITQEDGQKTIVQCKNFANPASPSVVRDLLGTIIDFNASSGILVCTGGFTIGTVEFANRNGIELLDASDLIRMSKQFNKQV